MPICKYNFKDGVRLGCCLRITGGGGDANYVDDDIGRGTRNFFQSGYEPKVVTEILCLGE